MSSYPPPINILTIFNQNEFDYSSSALTIANADLRYLRLTGGIESGLVTFNAGLSSVEPIQITDTAASISSSTGSLQSLGGAYFGNDCLFNTNLSVPTIKNGNFTGTMPNTLADSGTFITSASTPSFSGQCTFTYQGGTSLGNSTIYVNPSSAAAGSVSDWYYTALKDPSISSGTIGTASTFYIAGSPTGGTITNAYALNVASGTSIFQGALQTSNLQLLNGANIASLSFTGGSSITTNMPTVTGFLFQSNANFPTLASKGISLKDAQTISTAALLAGSSFNADSTTYTDSATAASGTVSQVSDFLIGQRTWNCSNTGITYTSAASLQVKGPPIAGTNCTITTGNAIQVDSGNIRAANGQFISVSAGTASSTAFSVASSTGMGMYSSAANTLNFSVSSGNRLSITGGALSPQVVVRNVTGSQAAPAMTWITDAASGIWQIGTGNMGVSCSNTKLMDWSTTAVAITVAGSASTPSLYWSTDSASGIYRPAANQIGITISGTQIGAWSSTGLTVTGNVKSASGYYVGNTTYNSISDSFVIIPNTTSTTGTSTLQITPTTSSWASTGTAQIIFGDTNHKISVENGSGMTITDTDGIKFTSAGSIFKQMNRSVTELTAPGANFATYTIAHGLGGLPIHADGTIDKNGFSANNDCFSVTIQSWDSTNIVWQIARVDTNSNWSNAYNLRWMAWR